MSITLADAIVYFRGDETGLDKSLDSSEQKTRSWTGRVGGFLRDSFTSTVSGVVGAGIDTITGSIGGLVDGMVSGNAEFERYGVQFGVLLGSVDAAKQRLADLARFGASTPFELPEVVRADKILQSFGLHALDSAKKFGMSGVQIRTIAGDLAAGTGASFEEISGYLGKFASGATGEAIARFQELGIVTRAELAGMGIEFSKSGELVTPVNEAMTIMLRVMKSKFGGMMDAQSATFEGMMSNLQDWKAGTLRTLGEPIFEVLRDKLKGVLEFLNSEEMQAAIQSFAAFMADGVGRVVTFFETSLAPAFMSIFNIAKLLVTGDWNGGIFGLYEDSLIMLFLFDVANAIQFVVQNVLRARDVFAAGGGGFLGIVAALGIDPETGATIVRGYEFVKAKLGELLDGVHDIVEDGEQWLYDNIATLRGNLSDGIGGVLDGVVARFATFSAAGGGAAGILAALGVDPETAGKVLAGYNNLKTWVAEGLAVIQAYIGLAVQWVRENSDAIAARLYEIAEQIKGALGGAFTWLLDNSETVKQVVGAIAVAFGAFMILTTVAGWVAALVASWGVLTAATAALTTFVVGAIAAINLPLILLAAAIGLLYVAWTSNWGGIQEATAAAFHYLYDLFLTAQETWARWWKEHGDVVTAYFGIAWSAIQFIVEQFIANIKTVIDLFILAAAGDWEGFGERLRIAWEETWQRIKDFLSAILPDVITLASGLLEPLVNFIEEVKLKFDNADWGQIGKDILEGIKNGIIEKFNQVKGEIENVASAIGGVFTGFFENASPSKLMARVVGAPVIQGILKGMEDILPAMLTRTGEIGRRISEKIAGSLTVADKVGAATGVTGAPAPQVPSPAGAVPTSDGTEGEAPAPIIKSAGGRGLTINSPLVVVENLSLGSREEARGWAAEVARMIQEALEKEFDDLLEASVGVLTGGFAEVPGDRVTG